MIVHSAFYNEKYLPWTKLIQFKYYKKEKLNCFNIQIILATNLNYKFTDFHEVEHQRCFR